MVERVCKDLMVCVVKILDPDCSQQERNTCNLVCTELMFFITFFILLSVHANANKKKYHHYFVGVGVGGGTYDV